MNEQVYISDGLRTRVESYSEPLNIITFIQKYHVSLHDGMRTPLNIEILTKNSASVFKIKHLASLSPEALPIIQPGSAMLVGERTAEERSEAKAWIGKNKVSSDVENSIESGKKVLDHQAAVTASKLPLPSSTEKTSERNEFYSFYKIGFAGLILLILIFSLVYLRRRRFPS